MDINTERHINKILQRVQRIEELLVALIHANEDAAPWKEAKAAELQTKFLNEVAKREDSGEDHGED